MVVDINACESSPCINRAMCNDALNGYTCDCVAGYVGTHCETGIEIKGVLRNVFIVNTVIILFIYLHSYY